MTKDVVVQSWLLPPFDSQVGNIDSHQLSHMFSAQPNVIYITLPTCQTQLGVDGTCKFK